MSDAYFERLQKYCTFGNILAYTFITSDTSWLQVGNILVYTFLTSDTSWLQVGNILVYTFSWLPYV